jgi:putative SOS response-associated peptidase YedK
MCYNVIAKYQKMLHYALLRGDKEQADFLIEKLEELQPSIFPYHHANGFSKPKIMVFTDKTPFQPEMIQWGLIPKWAGEDFKANTLNAKVEEYKEKPSYRKAGRCLVYVDGFYEHHDFNKKKYPFKIAMANGQPMVMAGLWDESKVGKTFSIVTTAANEIMAKIHNMAGRMPLVMHKQDQEKWLAGDSVNPVGSEDLVYHTVRALTGKNSAGNTPAAEEEFIYPDLHF